MPRPQLQPGASWGPDLSPSDLTVGDLFHVPATRQRGQWGGTITKINRVSFNYDAPYMNNTTLRLNGRLEDTRGGYVQRGNVVHRIAS